MIKSLNARLRRSSIALVHGGRTLREGQAIAYQTYQRMRMFFRCRDHQDDKQEDAITPADPSRRCGQDWWTLAARWWVQCLI